MDQFRCTAIISGPNDGDTFDFKGKTNFTTEWIANGVLNEQPMQNMNIRSAWQSPKNQMFYINAMNNGEQIDCVSDDYNGMTRWKLKKPYEEQGSRPQQGQQANYPQQGGPPAQRPAQQPPAQRKAQGGGLGVLPFERAVGLMDFCVKAQPSGATDTCIAVALFSAVIDAKILPPQKASGNNENMEQHFEDETVKAIGLANLGELFDACKEMNLATAVQLYRAANGDQAAFAQALSAAIQVLTPEPEPEEGADNLPF